MSVRIIIGILLCAFIAVMGYIVVEQLLQSSAPIVFTVCVIGFIACMFSVVEYKMFHK